MVWIPAGLYAASLSDFLVKDINPTPGAGSDPSPLVLSDGSLYLAADDGLHGREFWTTDGTPSGTILVMDIYEGSTGSEPDEFLDIGGKLFFAATEQPTGRELWIHDGTSTASVITHLLMDIYPGRGSSIPDTFVNLNSVLVFRADDEIHGKELWKADGKVGNTVFIKDIFPGTGGSYPQLLTPLGEYVYFRCDERRGVYGMELWRTNTVAEGTILVSDIRPGSGGSYPNYFAVLNNRLYFRANDGDLYKKGYELWTTDTSSTATTRVKDIWPGDPSSYPEFLTTVGDKILFAVNDGVHGRELYKTDGTADGTVLVKDMDPGEGSSEPHDFAVGNNTLFFRANETDTTYELWISDGSEGGTVLLHTFAKGPAPPEGFIDRSEFTNGRLIFPAYSATTGWELWQSDGTPGGTQLLFDFTPGSASSYAFPVGATDSGVLFSADDPGLGRELFRVDYSQNLHVDPSGPLEFTIRVWRPVGTPTAQLVTLRNTGALETLTFTGDKLRIEGPDAAEFFLPASLPSTLAPGQSVSLPIELHPTSIATKTATLVITTDDPDAGTVNVLLIGRPAPTGFMVRGTP